MDSLQAKIDFLQRENEALNAAFVKLTNHIESLQVTMKKMLSEQADMLKLVERVHLDQIDDRKSLQRLRLRDCVVID
jgi:hypothetical protein